MALLRERDWAGNKFQQVSKCGLAKISDILENENCERCVVAGPCWVKIKVVGVKVTAASCGKHFWGIASRKGAGFWWNGVEFYPPCVSPLTETDHGIKPFKIPLSCPISVKAGNNPTPSLQQFHWDLFSLETGNWKGFCLSFKTEGHCVDSWIHPGLMYSKNTQKCVQIFLLVNEKQR